MNSLHKISFSRTATLVALWVWTGCTSLVFSAMQSFDAGKVLPEDTLVFVTVPNIHQATSIANRTPYGRLWADPLLKSFRDNFHANAQKNFLEPAQREIGLSKSDWSTLFGGSVTFAVHRDSEAAGTLGWVLLLEPRQGTNTLRPTLDRVKQRWNLDGRQIATNTIGGHEFLLVALPTNSVLRSFGGLLPGIVSGNRSTLKEMNLTIGQAGGTLVISSSRQTAEKVVARLAGIAGPALANTTAYQTTHTKGTNAAVYAWINPKLVLEAYTAVPQAPQQPGDDSGEPLKRSQLIQASGLAALRSAGFVAGQSPRGITFELVLDVPETERRGLLKLLAGDPADIAIPAFVPRDAIRFQRWRIDGGKSWSTFQEMMSLISPQWPGTIDFILETANQAAQLKDREFDVRTNLLGNIGNDFIQYSKAPRNDSTQETGPALLLVQSPNPAQIAAALQRILIFLTADAESPAQRDFQGHTIYSVALPPISLPFETSVSMPSGRILHYSGANDYLALSTDSAMLEEFLDRTRTNKPALKDLPGLAEATAAVTSPGASLFLYENLTELTRKNYEAARTSKTLTGGFGPVKSLAAGLSSGFDYSLLPPFDQVSRHFHILVRTSTTTPDRLTVKWLLPAGIESQ